MGFLSLLAALVLEQVRPLSRHSRVDDAFGRLRDLALARCRGDGFESRGAWLLAVLGSGAAALVVHDLLYSLWMPLAFAFDAALLYFFIGFRRQEESFADVERALANDDIEGAARRLSAWSGVDRSGAGAGELARLTVEHAVLGAHRGIFGVIFWFVLMPGPMGAVMYRVACDLAQSPEASPFVRRAFGWLDWFPAHMTALACSVIGNFEEAIASWRTQAPLWPERSAGVVLAAAGGALGLRLGMPAHENGVVVDRPELGQGSAVDVENMPRAARLIWRVLVLLVLVLALLAVAGRVGG